MAKMVIKRVGILSMVKIFAVIMAAFGLLFGVIYGLVMMTVGAAMMSMNEGPGAGVGIVGGLAMMVILPVFYGLLGVVFGALYAIIYNVAAGFVGGIELELDAVDQVYDAPPGWDSSQYQPGRQYQSGQQPHSY